MSTIGRKLRTAARQPPFVLAWLLPVWLLLGGARALILTLSFRRLAPHLGRPLGANAWVPRLDPQQEQRALLIARVVYIAARHTPWISNCFPQAIAARVLLGLYSIPYALHFGLMRDPASAEMKAHAWVAAGKVRVTGGESFGQFTVVGCFVAPGLDPSRN
ncbi:MAG: lasso peptide biosynthesis B2 protein [Rhodocyclaceae bacterium]|nr:lasso peptide biosynthesis B2 protein [Rhodocyclaceae bacterium]